MGHYDSNPDVRAIGACARRYFDWPTYHMAYQRFRGDTLTSLSDPNQGATSEDWATRDPGLVNDAYAVQETLPTSTSSSLANKKRKQSKGKAVKSSSRSMSTPQAQRSGMSDSDIDKKRNKLGYQRISIACGQSQFPCRVGNLPEPWMLTRSTRVLIKSQRIAVGEKSDA